MLLTQHYLVKGNATIDFYFPEDAVVDLSQDRLTHCIKLM